MFKQSSSLKAKQVILVTDSYLKEYRLSLPLEQPTISFQIGPAFVEEMANMCSNLFLSTKQVSSFKDAKELPNRADLIIVPEIVKAEMFSPFVRFANIKTEISVRYSFYSPSGYLIDNVSVTGKGADALVVGIKKEYRLAMEAALKDLMIKSYDIFIEVLK
jgi:hypothetical protein